MDVILLGKRLPQGPGESTCRHNQHELASEIVDDLAQTSFARAMQIAKGTVSVVDGGGGCFERIWCVYELYRSHVSAKAGFTFDLVTATKWEYDDVWHGAVAITDGLSARQTSAGHKRFQEEAFPLQLVDAGVGFECLKGRASMPEDEKRIKAAIGNDSTLLDDTVHGVVAHAAPDAARRP